MKSYSLKPADVKRKWYIVDASEVTLGRLSTRVAGLLLDKSKPEYTPHVDSGDYVVVINASSLKVTGQKLTDKTYYRHSGHPGNLRQKTLGEQIATAPEKVIEKAVRGMLPVNKLRPGRMSRLKVYAGTEHAHTAQNPEILSLKEKS